MQNTIIYFLMINWQLVTPVRKYDDAIKEKNTHLLLNDYRDYS